MDDDWKIRQEIARLEVDIINLESSMRSKLTRMRKRLQKIKEYVKQAGK